MVELNVVADGATTSLLPGEIVTIPTGDVVLTVAGAGDRPLRVDGRVRATAAAGAVRLVSLDLTRSTGVHHVRVGGSDSYWFATEDAKLGLAGLQSMLRYMRESCRSWTGQLLFADGTGYADPLVLYGWLDQHADDAIAAAAAVMRSPSRLRQPRYEITAEASGHLSLGKSLALLRGRGRELLEPSPSGLQIGDKTYLPRKVVVERRIFDLDHPSNRRVVALLLLLEAMGRSVAAAADDPAERARCRQWAADAERLRIRGPLAGVPPESPSGQYSSASQLEGTDIRYSATRKYLLLARRVASWDPSLRLLPAHAFVDYVDQVYQAFVATVLAEALGMLATADVLGRVQPAFTSDRFDIYYNTPTTPSIVRSWRSYSVDPDENKPDVLLLERPSGRIAIADAKYRNNGRSASESSRRDLLGYMAAMGLRKVAILFPPSPADALGVRVVSGQGMSITEIGLAPTPDLPDFVARNAVPALLSVLAIPPWREP